MSAYFSLNSIHINNYIKLMRLLTLILLGVKNACNENVDFFITNAYIFSLFYMNIEYIKNGWLSVYKSIKRAVSRACESFFRYFLVESGFCFSRVRNADQLYLSTRTWSMVIRQIMGEFHYMSSCFIVAQTFSSALL